MRSYFFQLDFQKHESILSKSFTNDNETQRIICERTIENFSCGIEKYSIICFLHREQIVHERQSNVERMNHEQNINIESTFQFEKKKNYFQFSNRIFFSVNPQKETFESSELF